LIGTSKQCRGDRPALSDTKQKSIEALIAGFKSAVSKQINQKRGTPGKPVWQRNYWEHIISNEQSYQDIVSYIVDNPITWEMDKLYSQGQS